MRLDLSFKTVALAACATFVLIMVVLEGFNLVDLPDWWYALALLSELSILLNRLL